MNHHMKLEANVIVVILIEMNVILAYVQVVYHHYGHIVNMIIIQIVMILNIYVMIMTTIILLMDVVILVINVQMIVCIVILLMILATTTALLYPQIV